MSASAGDVEVVVATSAPARKLSKKQSFTGMPYDDVFCLWRSHDVTIYFHVHVLTPLGGASIGGGVVPL